MLSDLQPFIVVAWTGRKREDMPDDVRAAYDAAGLTRHTNVLAFVLNSNGKVIHAFDALTQFLSSGFGPTKQAMTDDLKRNLALAREKLDLPKSLAKKTTLSLPTVAGTEPLSGVRVYLWFGRNNLDHFRVPTVEAVAATAEERTALHWGNAPRTVPVKAIERWLEQVYPPAVMDGVGGFESIRGEMTWKPDVSPQELAAARLPSASDRFATLTGVVSFTMDNRNRSSYEGKLEMVIRYSRDRAAPRALRAVLDTTISRQSPDGRLAERVKMLATLESLPAEEWK